MKRLFLFFLTVCLSVMGLSMSPAAVRADFSQPVLGINITDGARFSNYPLAIMGTSETGSNRAYVFCGSLSDETCTAAVSIFAWNHLPPCLSPITINCIASVFAVDTAGNLTEGKFVSFKSECST